MSVEVATSIDDLFRQKPLNEIHTILRQTRDQVESKKQELRELVGDHYRSVLESSDHIRAMSECAAKVATGADRVEELITSMRQLATNPPGVGGTTSVPLMGPAVKARTPEQDLDFRLGQRIMELLEVPETVRAQLGGHEFVAAARVAVLEAADLQATVGGLIKQVEAMEVEAERAAPNSAATAGVARPRRAASSVSRFDFAALTRQQAATFRGLPRQIVASCVDAFSTAALDPASAGQSFVVHLLLEPSIQPVPLLRLFMNRRVELMRSLLDTTGAAAGAGNLSCSARLAAAAMAFEGTVVLSSSLCETGPGDESLLLKTALASSLEGIPDDRAAEERAAIEGRVPDVGGTAAFRRRVENLGTLLKTASSGANAMSSELGRLGGELANDWAPLESTSGATVRGLPAHFQRLIASGAGGSLGTCEALGATLHLCSEKVLAYRHALSGRMSDSWSSSWSVACKRFCPSRPAPLSDALVVVISTIEAACGQVVQERVGELELELVPVAEGDADLQSGVDADSSAGVGLQFEAVSEAQRREELRDIRHHCRLRVARFDDKLGEVLADLDHISRGGVVPSAVTAALLSALGDRLVSACDKAQLPPAQPLWPRSQEPNATATPSQRSWPLQRRAARAAIALDALLSAATADDANKASGQQSNLYSCLRSASLSGDAPLVARAERIKEELKKRSSDAFSVWARMAVVPDRATSSLDAFWRLANDEVPKACGWGDAKFAAGKAGNEARAIPVPIQASPFVFERLALGARRALEVSGGSGAVPAPLVIALKTALAESLMAAYDEMMPRLPSADGLKRSGMFHYLQWLFDLQFLRLALSAPTAGNAAGAASAAYQALTALLDKTESTALSDAVDRTLYQPVLKASVKTHIQGIKILFAPFFLHNPLYGVFFPGQGTGEAGALGVPSSAADNEAEGFEIQADFKPPLRPTLPRFPLLPAASASTLAHVSSAELDARLGLGADSAERAAARAAAASAGAASTAAVSSLTQSVGSALGSLGLGMGSGFGKALGGPLGSNWASSWGATGADSTSKPRPPQAV